MEEKIYEEAMEAYEKKDFIKALALFSQINLEDSKNYENKCIDNLEDIIYLSNKKTALHYLEELKFYKDHSYFMDAYKRKRTNFYSKLFMFSCALIATLLLIIMSLL